MQRRTFLMTFTVLPWGLSAWAQPRVDELAFLLAGQPVYFFTQAQRIDLNFLSRHLESIGDEELDRFLQSHPEERPRYLRIMHDLFDASSSWRCVPFAHPPGSPPAQAQNWGLPYE